MRTLCRLGWRVAVWLVLLASVLALSAAVIVPRIAGATPYTILTGSMQPGMPPGTLVVTKPVDFEQIAIGDVITYQLESGKPATVTHRVVGLGFSADGDRRLVTQGDANGQRDRETVREEQVRGVAWYSVPHLGRLNLMLTGDQRQTGVYLAAFGFIVFAVWQFGSAAVGKRRRAA